MIPIFRAKVENGKLTGLPVKYQSYLETLEGKTVEVKVQTARSQRSLNQNNYYRGVCLKLLSKHTGYTPDEMHGVCGYMFLKVYGDIEYVRSTTTLSTTEFESYLEEIKQWAALIGVVIPDPNEVE